MRGQASALYNGVRLVGSNALEEPARQILIDIDWYLAALAEWLASGVLPPTEAIESIREKYRVDAPAFVVQAREDLRLAE